MEKTALYAHLQTFTTLVNLSYHKQDLFIPLFSIFFIYCNRFLSITLLRLLRLVQFRAIIHFQQTDNEVKVKCWFFTPNYFIKEQLLYCFKNKLFYKRTTTLLF